MSPCVLVHSAWHDGSAWTAVLKHLARYGHTACGPTVAGHGPGGDKAVTPTQSTPSSVDFIVQQHLTEVVLLGHGNGGTIIAKVVEQVPDLMQRLIFWNAFVLNDGESIVDHVPPHYRTLFEQRAGAAPDRAVMLPCPLWREAFMNDADLALPLCRGGAHGPASDPRSPEATPSGPVTRRGRMDRTLFSHTGADLCDGSPMCAPCLAWRY